LSKSRLDAVGWLFWIAVFLVLIGPCIYGSWQITYPDKSRLYPIGTGAGLAAIASGFVSWAINAVLQRREKKQRIERRKKVRKRK
jgi:hypothetical protein